VVNDAEILQFLREMKELLIEIRDILREEQVSIGEYLDPPETVTPNTTTQAFVDGVQEAFRERQKNYPYG
jgi:hypothetical protein